MASKVSGPDAIGLLIDSIGVEAMHRVSRRLWESVRTHPPSASCDCPTAEVVAALIEEGFVSDHIGSSDDPSDRTAQGQR